MPLWTCPQCGDRKRGSSRPRRNATVRFCLSCSAKSDVLVAREARALEAKRADLAEARKRRQASVKERAEARLSAYYKLNGVNVLDELRIMWKTAAARDRRVAHERDDRTPTLKVRRPRRQRHWCGWARAIDQTISITAGEHVDPARILEILAHEVAHLCTPIGEHHGVSFTQVLNEIVRERWPTATGLPGHFGTKYMRGSMVYEAIRRVLNAERATPFKQMPAADEVFDTLENQKGAPV
jgi:hypothetical protein